MSSAIDIDPCHRRASNWAAVIGFALFAVMVWLLIMARVI
jgi:hypothetical protein